MLDPNRMKQLKEAKHLILSASIEEKEELFKGFISSLKETRERFKEPDNRFDTYDSAAYLAMDKLRIFTRKLIGYNMGWVPEKFLQHCNNNAGRNTKYNGDTRLINCIFISLLVQRGASETQAMKLLTRLRGDKVMTSGHLRELQDTYRDFKAVTEKEALEGEGENNLILDQSWAVACFLSFSISNLEGEEKASQKAVAAFTALWQEIIDLMKEYHPIIAKRDGSYPDIFGCTIDWVNAEYNNPLDYFYTHESHKNISIHERKSYLREYLNTIGFFMSEKR